MALNENDFAPLPTLESLDPESEEYKNAVKLFETEPPKTPRPPDLMPEGMATDTAPIYTQPDKTTGFLERIRLESEKRTGVETTIPRAMGRLVGSVLFGGDERKVEQKNALTDLAKGEWLADDWSKLGPMAPGTPGGVTAVPKIRVDFRTATPQQIEGMVKFAGLDPDQIGRDFEGRMEWENEQATKYGKRPDGTYKGTGWLGELPVKGGGVATEYSMQSNAVKVDGKTIDFPTLVPTLTQEERDLMVNDIIPNRKELPEEIVQKAITFAKERLAQGLSPFKETEFRDPRDVLADVVSAEAENTLRQRVHVSSRAAAALPEGGKNEKGFGYSYLGGGLMNLPYMGTYALSYKTGMGPTLALLASYDRRLQANREDQFGFTEEGDLGIVKPAMSPEEAEIKAWVGAAKETAIEIAGGKVVGAIAKPLAKGAASLASRFMPKTVDAISKFGQDVIRNNPSLRKFVEFWNTASEITQVQKYPVETFEEYADDVSDDIFKLSPDAPEGNIRDRFVAANKKFKGQLGDILLTLAFVQGPQAITAGAKTVGYAQKEKAAERGAAEWLKVAGVSDELAKEILANGDARAAVEYVTSDETRRQEIAKRVSDRSARIADDLLKTNEWMEDGGGKNAVSRFVPPTPADLVPGEDGIARYENSGVGIEYDAPNSRIAVTDTRTGRQAFVFGGQTPAEGMEQAFAIADSFDREAQGRDAVNAKKRELLAKALEARGVDGTYVFVEKPEQLAGRASKEALDAMFQKIDMGELPPQAFVDTNVPDGVDAEGKPKKTTKTFFILDNIRMGKGKDALGQSVNNIVEVATHEPVHVGQFSPKAAKTFNAIFDQADDDLKMDVIRYGISKELGAGAVEDEVKRLSPSAEDDVDAADSKLNALRRWFAEGTAYLTEGNLTDTTTGAQKLARRVRDFFKAGVAGVSDIRVLAERGLQQARGPVRIIDTRMQEAEQISTAAKPAGAVSGAASEQTGALPIAPGADGAGQAQELNRPTGATQPETLIPSEEKKTVSVPVMITKKMERDLLGKGYEQSAIDKMTPSEAWEALQKPTEEEVMPEPPEGAEPPPVEEETTAPAAQATAEAVQPEAPSNVVGQPETIPPAVAPEEVVTPVSAPQEPKKGTEEKSTISSKPEKKETIDEAGKLEGMTPEEQTRAIGLYGKDGKANMAHPLAARMLTGNMRSIPVGELITVRGKPDTLTKRWLELNGYTLQGDHYVAPQNGTQAAEAPTKPPKKETRPQAVARVKKALAAGEAVPAADIDRLGLKVPDTYGREGDSYVKLVPSSKSAETGSEKQTSTEAAPSVPAQGAKTPAEGLGGGGTGTAEGVAERARPSVGEKVTFNSNVSALKNGQLLQPHTGKVIRVPELPEVDFVVYKTPDSLWAVAEYTTGQRPGPVYGETKEVSIQRLKDNVAKYGATKIRQAISEAPVLNVFSVKSVQKPATQKEAQDAEAVRGDEGQVREGKPGQGDAAEAGVRQGAVAGGGDLQRQEAEAPSGEQEQVEPPTPPDDGGKKPVPPAREPEAQTLQSKTPSSDVSGREISLSKIPKGTRVATTKLDSGVSYRGEFVKDNGDGTATLRAFGEKPASGVFRRYGTDAKGVQIAKDVTVPLASVKSVEPPADLGKLTPAQRSAVRRAARAQEAAMEAEIAAGETAGADVAGRMASAEERRERARTDNETMFRTLRPAATGYDLKMKLKPLKENRENVKTAIAAIHRQLVKENVSGRTTPSLQVVEPVYDDATQVSPEMGRATIAEIERIFQKTIVFVDGGDVFGGIIHTKHPDFIFINPRSESPYLQIAGHELWHTMEQDNPALYNDVLEALTPALLESDVTKQLVKNKVFSTPGAVDEYLAETTANLFGQNFSEPEFWNLVAERNPTLFQRLTDYVLEWIEKVFSSWRGERMDATPFYGDLKNTRKIVANAVSKYAELRQLGDTMFRVTPSGEQLQQTEGTENEQRNVADRFDLPAIALPDSIQREMQGSHREKLAEDLRGVHRQYQKDLADDGEEALAEKYSEKVQEELRQKEEGAIEDYVARNGLFIPPSSFFDKHEAYKAIVGAARSGGMENTIYVSPEDPGTVVKMNNMTRYTSWLDFLNRLAVHNFLFPETAYELVGFTRVEPAVSNAPIGWNSISLRPVLKQAFVDGERAAQPADMKRAMGEKGFSETTEGSGTYTSDRYPGIVVSDLHDGNGIVAADGTVIVFDPAIQTTREFSTVNFRVSQPVTPAEDAEYMAAVEAGDMEKAQSMVDEAAKRAGYTQIAYHGGAGVNPYTGRAIQVFNVASTGRSGKERGAFFTSEKQLADDYKRAWEELQGSPGAVYRVALNLNGAEIRRNVYDAPTIRNAWNKPSDVFVVSSANQIKSADPITRDDQGNVIPLSQRFNEATPDIRFRVDQTETPEFKRWFGDSKVVDADGKPLVVYRGDRTGKTVFTGREDPSNYIQGNVFFTSEPFVAAGYSAGRRRVMSGLARAASLDEKEGLYRAYLSIEKPLIVDAKGEGWDSVPFEGRSVQIDDLGLLAQKRGYDGMIVENVFDQYGESTQYVAFRPEQIKSATGNVGTFDPTNPDIRFRVSQPQDAEDLARAQAQFAALRALMDKPPEDFYKAKGEPDTPIVAPVVLDRKGLDEIAKATGAPLYTPAHVSQASEIRDALADYSEDFVRSAMDRINREGRPIETNDTVAKIREFERRRLQDAEVAAVEMDTAIRNGNVGRQLALLDEKEALVRDLDQAAQALSLVGSERGRQLAFLKYGLDRNLSIIYRLQRLRKASGAPVTLEQYEKMVAKIARDKAEMKKLAEEHERVVAEVEKETRAKSIKEVEERMNKEVLAAYRKGAEAERSAFETILAMNDNPLGRLLDYAVTRPDTADVPFRTAGERKENEFPQRLREIARAAWNATNGLGWAPFGVEFMKNAKAAGFNASVADAYLYDFARRMGVPVLAKPAEKWKPAAPKMEAGNPKKEGPAVKRRERAVKEAVRLAVAENMLADGGKIAEIAAKNLEGTEWEGITPLEVMEIVTGYPVQPDIDTRDELDRRVAMVRKHMLALQRLQELEQNKYPTKMTLPADKPDVTLRQLARELRDRMNDFQFPAGQEDERLLNAERALASRLRYAVEELQKAVDAGTPINEKAPRAVAETPEIAELRRTLKDLRAAYEALPAVEAIKEARDAERARRAANKRYHFWQKRAEDAKNGVFPETSKACTTAERDAEAADYAKKAEAARREYWAIKKASPQERVRVMSEKVAKAEERLADLEAKLALPAAPDLRAPKKPEAAPASPEEAALARTLAERRAAIERVKKAISARWREENADAIAAVKEAERYQFLVAKAEMLEDRIRRGDFSKAPVRPRVWSARVAEVDRKVRAGLRAINERIEWEANAAAGIGGQIQNYRVKGREVYKFYKTMWDLSAVGVQSARLFGYDPIYGTKLIGQTAMNAMSDEDAARFQEAMHNDADYEKAFGAGLALDQNYEDIFGTGMGESFMRDLERWGTGPDKGVGKRIVGGSARLGLASQRAFEMYSRMMRFHVFKSIINDPAHANLSKDELRTIANMVNIMGGVGNTKFYYRDIASVMSRLMWSSRLFTAQWQTLTGGGGLLWNAGMARETSRAKLGRKWYQTAAPGALKLYSRSLAGTFALSQLFGAIGMLLGDRQPWEDEETMFWKAFDFLFGRRVIGSKSIDTFGGLTSYTALVKRAFKGSHVTMSGKTRPDDDWKAWAQTFANFARGRLRPDISLALSAVFGEDVTGKPFGPRGGAEGMKNLAIEAAFPITPGDMQETVADMWDTHGVVGVTAGLVPALASDLFGFSKGSAPRDPRYEINRHKAHLGQVRKALKEYQEAPDQQKLEAYQALAVKYSFDRGVEESIAALDRAGNTADKIAKDTKRPEAQRTEAAKAAKVYWEKARDILRASR